MYWNWDNYRHYKIYFKEESTIEISHRYCTSFIKYDLVVESCSSKVTSEFINMLYKYNKKISLKELTIIKKTIFTIIMLLALLTGCTDSNNVKSKEYDGEKLLIGIIGNIPEIRELQIEFKEIDFDILKKDNFDSQYDAVFITKDNLSEASNAEYAPIYKESEIPFYFIDNEKSHVSFIEEDLSYEDEPDSKSGRYITGLLYVKERFWGYGLYNDTKSDINIKDVYSRVFQDISEIKNNELP